MAIGYHPSSDHPVRTQTIGPSLSSYCPLSSPYRLLVLLSSRSRPIVPSCLIVLWCSSSGARPLVLVLSCSSSRLVVLSSSPSRPRALSLSSSLASNPPLSYCPPC